MSKFISSILKLLTATILGQILGILVMPLLSRLYTPADFGLFQLFISLVALIATISCLSYSSAINLPQKHEDAANIVTLCFFLIIITAVITTIFFVVFSENVDRLLNSPGLSYYLLLLPFAIIFNSFAYVLSFWLSRREEFGTMAKGNLYSSVSGKAVSVGSGVLSPSPFGLIFGTIINDATLFVVFLRSTIADSHLFREVSYEKMKQLAYRYKKFPQYDLIARVANSATMQCTPFLLVFFFSPIIVGYYAMANLVINLPVKLVANSFSSVFYQKICTEKKETGCIKNIVRLVHTRLVSIGMFGCLIIMIIGPELFTFILGKNWYTAGVYAQILTPYFFVVFISVPLFSILNVMEKQDIFLWFNLLTLFSTIVVLIIGGLSGNPLIVMLLLSCNGIVFWSWVNMTTLKIAGVSRRDAGYEIIRYLLFGLLFCLPLIIAKYYSIQSPTIIFIALIVSVFYYMVIVYQDKQLKNGLVNFIGQIRQK